MVASKTQPIVNKEVVSTSIDLKTAQLPATVTIPAVPEKEHKAISIIFPQSDYDVIFDESQGTIQEAVFKRYKDYRFNLKTGFSLDDQILNFRKTAISAQAISFVAEDPNKRITKSFNFLNSNYGIDLEIKIQNLTNGPLSFNLPLNLGILDFSGNQEAARFQEITVVTDEKTLRPNAHKDAYFDRLKFVAIRDRYFCAIIEPENNFQGFIKKLGPQESEIGVISKDIIIPANQAQVLKFHIYLGPQELRSINAVKPAWSTVIYYGMFDIISHILLQALDLLYKIVHNWGWAIILLSLLVYFALYPLTLKQMRSMKDMQAIQPKIEALRKEYKDNPQKLNKEIMELYREHKVNPFGGCLPLVLQMPIFFALYQALMRSIVLKGAKFLWIKDLSEPDRLFTLPQSLPVLGNEINILPIIMAIGMFVQQKMSMTSMSGSGAEQQKIMLIIMPIMFGIIFYHMPAGLVLYWFVNSMLMLIYQIRVSRAK